MLRRPNREFPSHQAQGFAAKASDLESLRIALVDAAGVGGGLWLSYLFALFYFAIAAGAVTHRDLLFENPVKLPFLNVELPLKAFFILGPFVFLIVHLYVLLHFVLLADKVNAFHRALEDQIKDDDTRARLRRQLPSNVFVQFLAGPRDLRAGIIGFLLRAVAQISLVVAPIALLVLFQLQFLPYHSGWITWWQRIAVLLDLVMLWLLWPPIVHGSAAFLRWRELARPKAVALTLASIVPLLLVFTIATYPGEWLEETLPSLRLVPTTREAWQLPSLRAIQKAGSGWATPHELLVAGEVNYVTRQPKSLWSNVLVLPNIDVVDHRKYDSEVKIAAASETASFRGRHLEGAVLVAAHLRKVDFTGVQAAKAIFSGADLRETNFGCDPSATKEWGCSQLQGAALEVAQLQGAELWGAQLQGASLKMARLQGATLIGAQLQSATLIGAELQGASLLGAQLQGAELDGVRLEGAWLLGAELQGATLVGANLADAALAEVYVWKTTPPGREELTTGALIVNPKPAPISTLGCEGQIRSPCAWTNKSYVALKSLVERVWAGALRGDAVTSAVEQVLPSALGDDILKRIAPLGRRPYREDLATASAWRKLAEQSGDTAAGYPTRLAERLVKIGCNGDADIIHGLIVRLRRYLLNDPIAPQKAAVAAGFLKPDCPGARGLPDADKITLQQIKSSAQE